MESRISAQDYPGATVKPAPEAVLTRVAVRHPGSRHSRNWRRLDPRGLPRKVPLPELGLSTPSATFEADQRHRPHVLADRFCFP